MYILGISGGLRMGMQDAAAALFYKGKLIAAAEEERFTRVKFAPGQLPYYSIISVLESVGLNISDIKLVATHGATWGERYNESLKEYFKIFFHHTPEIIHFHHHDAHAASAFYASGLDKALVLSMDNSGDGISTQLAVYDSNAGNIIFKEPRPNSLGIFYSMITQFCGFKKESDEYKLMGLASYGDKSKVDLSGVLSEKGKSYELDTSYIYNFSENATQPSQQQTLYSKKLIERLGKNRTPQEPISDYYKNIAASTQAILEQVIIHIINSACNETGIKKICLAGGVALNCAANRILLEQDFVEQLFVQPASGDSGIAIGVGYLAAVQSGYTPENLESVCLGKEYGNESIEKHIKLSGVKYQTCSEPAVKAAELIASNKVIGWFQGQSEFGPRALGSRSILANVAQPSIKNTLNQKIKFRESFRPFCPALLDTEFDNFYIGKQKKSPYMTINYLCKKYAKSVIPGAIHVDDTSRIQTVSKNSSPLFYEMLTELKSITGTGACINTSFNRSNEPIVESPVDALATFFSSGLDFLVMGNYFIAKK